MIIVTHNMTFVKDLLPTTFCRPTQVDGNNTYTHLTKAVLQKMAHYRGPDPIIVGRKGIRRV